MKYITKIKGKINTFGKKLRESVTSKSLKSKKSENDLIQKYANKRINKEQ